MKTTLAALLMLLSLNTFADTIPNLDCTGTAGEKSTKLEYRDGAAAFMNVYLSDLNQKLIFLVVLNAANPVLDTQDLPVTLILGTVDGKTLKEKNTVMKIDQSVTTIKTQLSDGSLMTLSCTRLPAL